MAHRNYPILSGLALGLACLTPQPCAAAVSGNAPEYNGLSASRLASRDARGTGAPDDRLLRIAQAEGPLDDAGADARTSLKKELDRIRREAASGAAALPFEPPLPVKRKTTHTEPLAFETVAQPEQRPGRTADAQVDRLLGKLLLLSFKGSQPADAGPKAIHALLQSGAIAGAVFTRENIQSKAQLKELMKSLWTGSNRPIFALREIGGVSDALPPIKDFERWPSERDIAAQGDPQYAYSTYRSMGSNLAKLGFNVNFGPILSVSGQDLDPAASFGSNALQAGVFTKTFILGHREENVIAVPLIDGSEHSVRALKTIAVSDPGIPIGSIIGFRAETSPFSAYEGIVRGARFCFIGPALARGGSDAVSAFKQGCDILVLSGGADKPAAIREEAVLALSQAVQEGEVTLAALSAAVQRASELRVPGAQGSQ